MNHSSSQDSCFRSYYGNARADTVVAGPDQIPTSRPYGLERVAEADTDTNWDNFQLQIFKNTLYALGPSLASIRRLIGTSESM